jgi:hypothetical protein
MHETEKYARELAVLLERRDKIRLAQLRRYQDGSATRARTTTSNANASRLNDRIVWLREEIKKGN